MTKFRYELNKIVPGNDFQAISTHKSWRAAKEALKSTGDGFVATASFPHPSHPSRVIYSKVCYFRNLRDK